MSKVWARASAGGVLILGSLLMMSTDFAQGKIGSRSVADSAGAAASFISSDGRVLGSARLLETPVGVLIRFDLSGVPAGAYQLSVAAGGCSIASREGGIAAKPTLLATADPLVTLPSVHAGADGRVRAEILTEAVQLDPNGILLLGDRPVAMTLTAEASWPRLPFSPATRPIACGTLGR